MTVLVKVNGRIRIHKPVSEKVKLPPEVTREG